MKKIIAFIYILIFPISIWSQEEIQIDSIKYLWSIADKEMAVNKQKQFLKAIPNLKKIALLSKKENDDNSWAFANIYIAYCFLLNEESDSLGYYAHLVGDTINDLKLSENYASLIYPSSSFLIGKHYYDKGWYEQAITFYQKTIDQILELVGYNKEGIINYEIIDEVFIMNSQDLFNDAALVYYKMGDYLKSLEYFEIALKLSSDKNNMRILSNASSVHLELGNLEKGISFIRKSNRLLTDLSKSYNRETLALNYKNLSHYYNLKHQYDSSQISIKKALTLDIKDEFKIKTQRQYLKSIQYNFPLNHINQKFDSVFHITQHKLGFLHPEMARNYLLKGNILQQQNDFVQAEENYNIALNILSNKNDKNCTCKQVLIETLNDKRLALKIIQQKAENLAELKQKKPSLDCYSLLHELLRKLQQDYIINEESKYFLANKAKGIYESAIQMALLNDDLETAYEFSQSSRNMLILQQIQNKNAILNTNIPQSLLEEGDQLKLKINTSLKYKNQAIINKDKEALKKWNASIFSYNKSYEKWIAKIEQDYPIYFALKHNSTKKSISEINQTLRYNNKILLEYFLGKEQLFLFILDGKNIQVKVQDIKPSLQKNINIILEIFNVFEYNIESFTNFHQSAYFLYSQLLKEAIDDQLIHKNNIIIIPDESLNLIPFEALISQPYQSNQQKINYSQLDFLVQDFNISYAYSSNLISKPSSQKNKPAFLGIAPSFESNKIPALKFNQKEIQKINQLYQGETILGKDGTTGAFSDKIKDFNIIHLATHAIFNDKIPLDSRIELADSSIFIYEIAALSHNLQLAVISACQTASGQKKQGEGIISLSRSFIESGCPSVVASLWDVSDGKAGRILYDFHKNLKENNQAKDLALANAKRKYLKEAVNINSHPFFWAGFIQLGDSSSLVSPTSFNSWTYFIISTIIIFLLFIFFKVLKNK